MNSLSSRQTLGRAKSQKQAGYSLIELSVALAIVAVILMGVLVGTRQVMLSNSVNNQVRDMAAVISKVQRQYTKQASTAGASNDVLGPLAIWPADRSVNTSGVWTIRGIVKGSSEYIFSNTAAIGTLDANNGYIYTLRQVPTEACAELATALDSLAFSMYVGATPTAAPTTGATPTSTVVKSPDTSAITMASLATACAPNSANGVDISIVVRQ